MWSEEVGGQKRKAVGAGVWRLGQLEKWVTLPCQAQEGGHQGPGYEAGGDTGS